MTAANDDAPEAGRLGLGGALDDEEIAWLDGFLQSAEVPPTAMSLEELDGFITGLVIGPDVVTPSEYMPMIWGGEDGDSPELESLEQIQRFLGLLMRRRNKIGRAHV